MLENTKKKRLNIAIITNNYTPYSGGVVSSIDSFVNELHKQEHKAFIITLDFLGITRNDPYHVIRIPSLFRFMYKKNHMALAIKKEKKLQEIIDILKPDIIHVQHPFYLCQPAAKIAKKLNIPVIFTYHTIYEKYLHYLPLPQFITRPIVKKIVLSFCRNVDYIVSPSSYIKNYLESNNIETKIEKIPSGILPIFIKDQVYAIERTETTEKNGKNIFNLIFVSRFVKEKNIEFLLCMFAKLVQKNPDKNFKLTLAGYGSEYEKIKKFAHKKLKLTNYIQFIYRPRKEDIADLYMQSDAFIFSSDSDTQGLVLAEAMGCGCPVIALDGPGQRDIIKDCINGFLCNFESDMIEKIL
ncbi:MAG: glycosyltransferase, partial [uncultured bacterium]